MASTEVSFEKYSAYSWVLRGEIPPSTIEEVTSKFEATFNDRLKGGAGWIIRNRHESAVSEWITLSDSLHQCEGSATAPITAVSPQQLLVTISVIEGQLHTLKQQVSRLDSPHEAPDFRLNPVASKPDRVSEVRLLRN